MVDVAAGIELVRHIAEFDNWCMTLEDTEALRTFVAAYDRLAKLEQAFVKVHGRWYIRSPHGYMPVADDIAYLVARAFEHPEWPENPGVDDAQLHSS